jgi:ubiquinone/menaquinone biosynthesis C-methylase UbiE
MIRYASREAPASTNCRFQVGVAEALGFPADHFDVVRTILVMHHLARRSQARGASRDAACAPPWRQIADR